MTNYAIVGDGAAGSTTAEFIRRNDPNGRITVYSEDPTPAYYRAALTNYLMGELRAEQLFAVPPDFYTRWRVDRVLARAESLDTTNRRITLSNGQQAPYDQLMIASGARAAMPPFKGGELTGVMPMRTMQDGRFCMDMVQSGHLKHAVIVGGGILGIEWVAGLRHRGVSVTFVIREDQFWAGVVDKAASDLVLSRCRHFGVDVRLQEEVEEVFGKDGHFTGVQLKNAKERAKAQLLGVAIGIRPNVEFLAGSGIATGRGIPVDEGMRTNVADVYAGGDVAEVYDPFTDSTRGLGLWEPARHHGRVAGTNMSGGAATWKMQVGYNATRLYDLDLASVGDVFPKPTDDVLLDFPTTGGRISYRKLVIRDGKLVGALLLGLRKEKVREAGRTLRKVVASEADVTSIRDKLFDPFFDLRSWLATTTTATSVNGLAKRDSPSLASLLGRRATPASVDPAASANLATLMRTPNKMARGAQSQTVSSPVEPGGLSMTARNAPPASVKLPDGRVVMVGERLTIGSAPESSLRIVSTKVAEKHAEIRRKGNGFVLSALASSSGTFVNERAVAPDEARTLAHKDVISVGDASFDFISQTEAPRADTGPAGLPDEPLTAAPVTDLGVKARLEFLGGRVGITGITTDIGQDPSAEVRISDEGASFVHAQISAHDGGLYLRDLGSRNGTFVNDAPVSIPHPLEDGDRIRIANTVLIFRTTDGPAPVRQAKAASTAPTAEVAVHGAATLPSETGARPSLAHGDVINVSGSDLVFRSKGSEPVKEPPAFAGAKLEGVSAPVTGIAISLSKASLTIGSSTDADITVAATTMESEHARIEARGAEWVVQDLGSGRTFLNDEKLPHGIKALLSDGDEMRLGDVIFRFRSTKYRLRRRRSDA